MSKKTRIVIADDHEVVRTGLVNLLAGTEIEIVGQSENGKDVDGLVEKLNPDVVVLDLRMAEGDGMAALGRLKSSHPELPVLILTTFDNPQYVARAIALGACGYLLKGAGRDQIVEALRTAADGKVAFTRDEMRRVTGALATPRVGNDIEAALTHRESEVLQHMATGLTNKEIAVQLSISYETVKEHVQHILRKLGVSDRTQAAVWAVRKGLV
jgi:DNA-binding NarL/FixJ family response regulator